MEKNSESSEEEVPSFPTPFQLRTLWSAICGISILVLLALLTGLIWGTSWVAGFLQPVLLPVAVAGILAYLLEPIVHWLILRKLRKLHAVSLVFGTFALLSLGITAIIVPVTAQQANRLYEQSDDIYLAVSEGLKGFAAENESHPIVEWFSSALDADGNRQRSQAEEWFANNFGEITNTLWNLLSRGFAGMGTFLGVTIGLLLAPVYLWFFLLESSKIKRRWHEFLPLRASRFKDEIVGTLTEINDYLAAFFRGQMLVSLIDGVLVAVGLFAFGLPYALLIGFFVALLGLIPFLGNLLCLIPSLLIAFFHFSLPENQYQWLGNNVWLHVLAVFLIFTMVQNLNSLVTQPKIVGDSVGLHPMTVIFSVLFWTLFLGGMLGPLLAVPLTASLKVILKRYVWDRTLNVDPQESPAVS
ncbi:MAG: AI-2E family transporter [Verrucomicrobiota bacterium]